jgi:hypothetical protein
MGLPIEPMQERRTTMESTPSYGAANTDPTQGLMAQIAIGMDVADSSGEVIGKVKYLQNGDLEAVDVGSHAPVPGQAMAVAFGAKLEPDVPEGLVPRLLRTGYIKIEDKRHFRRDHHYYALADEIVSVDAGVVRLSKALDELIVEGS